jgi:hypothetical protein
VRLLCLGCLLCVLCLAPACGAHVDGPAGAAPPAAPAEGGPDAPAPPDGPGPAACGSYPLPVLNCATCIGPSGAPSGGGPPACWAGTWECVPLSELPDCPCSIVGTWNVTSDAHSGTNAAFEFNADGTFVGGPRGAMLPSGAIYAGSWTVIGDMLTVGLTSGFPCNMGRTIDQVSFSSECDAVTLQDVGDDCTGGRNYFDGSVLTRQ